MVALAMKMSVVFSAPSHDISSSSTYVSGDLEMLRRKNMVFFSAIRGLQIISAAYFLH